MENRKNVRVIQEWTLPDYEEDKKQSRFPFLLKVGNNEGRSHPLLSPLWKLISLLLASPLLPPFS